MRLDQFLQNFFSSFSRQSIKKKISSGDIKIFNRPHPHKPSTKVYKGEEIEIVTYNPSKKLKETPQIIFEDEDILVTTKPPFMTTHPTGRHLFDCLTVYYEEKLGHKIHSIHRLDKETSGVQILGKNPKGANMITPLFEEGLVLKAYFFIAKAYGEPFPKKSSFTAQEGLGNEKGFIPRLFTHCFPKNSQRGKNAETKFHIFYREPQKPYALGFAFPKTGRQHQIRAHASYHGFPLLGDKLYNGDPHIFSRDQDGRLSENDKSKMEISRQALHALELSLPYPDLKAQKTFTANLPEDLSHWVHENLSIKTSYIMKEWEKARSYLLSE